MRRRSVLLSVAVVLALGLGAGIAWAMFNVTGTGSGTASVGTLAMTNTDSGTYVVNFTGEYPSFSSSGSLTLTNSGNVPANSMTLSVGTPSDHACGLVCPSGVGTSTDLSGEATITVVDTTTSTTIFGPTSI